MARNLNGFVYDEHRCELSGVCLTQFSSRIPYENIELQCFLLFTVCRYRGCRCNESMTTFDLLSSYHGTYLTILMFSKQNLKMKLIV